MKKTDHFARPLTQITHRHTLKLLSRLGLITILSAPLALAAPPAHAPAHGLRAQHAPAQGLSHAEGNTLPHGWQRKLKVGEALDPQMAPHAVAVEGSLRDRLPIAPVGTIDLRIEDKIVRVYEDTRVIALIIQAP